MTISTRLGGGSGNRMMYMGPRPPSYPMYPRHGDYGGGGGRRRRDDDRPREREPRRDLQDLKEERKAPLIIEIDHRASSKLANQLANHREFSLEEIEKKLKKDSLINPLTATCGLILCLSLIYLVFVAPFVGGGLVAFFIVVCAGLAGFCLWGWKRFVSGKSYLRKKFEEFSLEEQNLAKEAEKTKLVNKVRQLEEGFKSLKYDEGLKELFELTQEYKNLMDFLGRRPESQILPSEQVLRWANETYQQGLNLLSCIFEIMNTISGINVEVLEKEAAILQEQIKNLRKDPAQSEMVIIKESTMKSHNERIAKVRELELSAAKFLSQSDECEAVLNKTRINLNLLGVEESEEKAKEVIERLKRVIDNALAVQEELKRVGELNA